MLAGVISGAYAQESNDHSMRARQIESVAIAVFSLDADSVAGSGLAGNGDVGFANFQSLRFDNAADPKEHGAGSFRLNRFAQTARTGVVEVRDEKNFSAAFAFGIGAIALGTGECQSAAPNRNLLRVHLTVELPVCGFDNGPGLRQPIKRRWLDSSRAIGKLAWNFSMGQVPVTLRFSRSMTATRLASGTLMKMRSHCSPRIRIGLHSPE